MFTRLRDLREDHDLKQETLAEELGIRQTTYSKYELGKIAVPASALIRIADFYHVSLDYLVGRDAGPAKAEPVRPGLYRHFKGKEYRDAGAAGGLSGPVRGAGRLGTPRLHVERTRGTGRLFRTQIYLFRRMSQ